MYQIKTQHKELLADTITPVSVYLKVRDRYPNSILLESTDHGRSDNSFSYICFNPIASIKVVNEVCYEVFPDNKVVETKLVEGIDLAQKVEDFKAQFEVDDPLPGIISTGLFGYMSYDSVRYFESVKVSAKGEERLPDLHYKLFRNVIAIDHYHNKAYLFSHNYNQDHDNLDEIEAVLRKPVFASYGFRAAADEQCSCTDAEFLEAVDLAKAHCQRGDVFQMVLSRRYRQSFSGDEFNVYRALRSINPSPYLFYFDFGDFKVFGSSPEAQLRVNNGEAEIHPIAGTFRRTGVPERDRELATALAEDPKENAEHVMLVDLARNDLSRNGRDIEVTSFRELQFFSHVIHLVSKVTAKVDEKQSVMQLAADTFPAGTLSGAPKHKALQLIEKYERCARGLYGGAIGFMDFKGHFNHAIIIRSFVSRDQQLSYQAGAGIVVDSQPQSELEEVNNKLAALRKALESAQHIG